MITIMRRLEWDAGHRIVGHTGKCRHLHGHRYSAEITVVAPELNELGMIVDFSEIKEKLGKWIDDHLDHNMLLNSKDPLWLEINSEKLGTAIFGDRTPFIFVNENPTAENIAKLLFNIAREILSVTVVHVRVYETPNCRATYYSENT